MPKILPDIGITMVKRMDQQKPVEMIDLYEQQNNIKLSTTLISEKSSRWTNRNILRNKLKAM